MNTWKKHYIFDFILKNSFTFQLPWRVHLLWRYYYCTILIQSASMANLLEHKVQTDLTEHFRSKKNLSKICQALSINLKHGLWMEGCFYWNGSFWPEKWRASLLWYCTWNCDISNQDERVTAMLFRNCFFQQFCSLVSWVKLFLFMSHRWR